MNRAAFRTIAIVLVLSTVWRAAAGIVPPRQASAAEPREAQLLLRGGTLHDGSGNESIVSDVAVSDGRIVAVGQLAEIEAEVVIDCTGLVVCPGFIDLHTHSDRAIAAPETRGNVNYLLQGCTTVVTGNCGSGPVDVESYLAKVDRFGAGTHVAHLLPQGSLRNRVLGKERRAPTSDELARMRELAQKAMEEGAFGMSTGLIYVPGTFADTDELVEIAKTIGQYGGIYASHIRGEGAELLESVQEAIAIGRRGELPVHVSHFKAKGRGAWGSLHLAVHAIETARQEGLKVTADQYPYAASSTSLEATLLPGWSRAGGRKELLKRLDDPEKAQRIREAITKNRKESIRIQIASYSPRPSWVGKSLDEIAAEEKIPTIDLVVRMVRSGSVSVVNFAMNEDDVRQAMKLPWMATASDGSAKIPTANRPHPRSFGTFPRKIGRYAEELQVLSLAHAIRSATGLPADILGLDDRGYLRAGQVADIAVFDPAQFRDHATYDQPYHPPTGMRYVFVSGVPAVYEEQATGALAGKALRKRRQKAAAEPQPAEKEASRDAGWAAEALAEEVRTDEGYRDELGLDFDAYQDDLSDLPIGVFDSGVGGLTILEELLTIDQHQNATGQPGSDGIPDFQGERFIYLGDQANMPYGNYAAAGREDFLRQLIMKDAIFLLGRRHWPAADAAEPVKDKPPVKAIVIACNTATAYGLDDVRAAINSWGLPVPVVGVVEAGADSVVRTLPRDAPASGAIAVMATVGTCDSNAYPRAIARAAGQTGRRVPTVWQQGSFGLAGAIEGNPAFLFQSKSGPGIYEGPAVANSAAPIDPELAAIYDFDPDGLVGDSDQPETWRLSSVENYVRYDVATMMENYRRSGATLPIESVVLGCTHFPYEADRIRASLERLRHYQDTTGTYPYRDFIAEEVRLVDTGALTAQQLYRRLSLDRRLNRDGGEAPPSLHSVFLSVPAPEVSPDVLTDDGGFSRAYKYGRDAGNFDVEDVRVIPLNPATLPDAARNLLQQHAPHTWQALDAIRNR